MLANQPERMSLFLVTSSSCRGHSSCTRSKFCHKFYLINLVSGVVPNKMYGKSLRGLKSGPGPPKTIKFGQMGDR